MSGISQILLHTSCSCRYQTEQAAAATVGSSAPYQPVLHEWIQTSEVTTTKKLSHLVHEITIEGVKSFYCAWRDCQHPTGFTQKPQLITHIRSIHLKEKPFLCTTWFVPSSFDACASDITVFMQPHDICSKARRWSSRQRHESRQTVQMQRLVSQSASSPTSIVFIVFDSQRAFTRRHYRDSHQEGCSSETSGFSRTHYPPAHWTHSGGI